MPDITPYLDWIEAHKTTVDLVKWGLLLFIAWTTGAFRFLRTLTRKPKVEINQNTSRCLIEEFSEFGDYSNAVRATFLVEVGITNPTNEKICIKSFYLAFPRHRVWNRWKPELHPISLPNRPRHEMGSGSKLLKCWFSHFPDELGHLTLSGDIGPREFHSGYLLFVSFTHNDWNPLFSSETINTRVSIVLTTGEIKSKTVPIKVRRDPQQFEQWVPGIIKQISHETSWNTYRSE